MASFSLVRQKWHMRNLAKNLKKRAKELGLSDAEIARRTGLPTRRYGHYATGYREPNLDTLMAICEVLDVSPNQLLGWNKEDIPSHSGTGAAQSKLTSLATAMSAEQIDMLLEIGLIISKKQKKT
ncbi:helix-turn-helix protein [Rhodobiaceae bacterium]|jgi:transcriptional regulator with XRE-family HTH domain|nr:helix-turn-helix protein [Rhodobiaceae bacterium]